MTNDRMFTKFVSSLMNVLLVLGVLVVLFPLSAPTAKADTYWYDGWTIGPVESYEFKDDTLIFNGTLTIEGSLTLDNCILYMREKTPVDPGELIDVDGGTFNVLNNSLITTHPSEPDPYEFRIDGTALIENSTVEKMKNLGSFEDGIRIYSDDVQIRNSTVQLGYGTGIYIEDAIVSITNSSIIDNHNMGVYIYNVNGGLQLDHNNISSNGNEGIYIVWSSYINVTGNNISNNYRGMRISGSSSLNITNNNFTNNGIFIGAFHISHSNTHHIPTTNSVNGKPLYYYKNSNGINIDGINIGQLLLANCTNFDIRNLQINNTNVGLEVLYSTNINIMGNNISSNWDGIGIYYSSNNNITGNNLSSNIALGTCLVGSSNNKINSNNVSNNLHGVIIQDSSNSNEFYSNYVISNTILSIRLILSNGNKIIDNDIQNNIWGPYLTNSNYNLLYHNNLKNNNQNAYDDGSNYWDNGLEGNWWDDNLNPGDTDGDGICDQSYSGTSFVDYKPLANEDNDRVLVDDPWFWFIQSGVNFAEPGWTVYAKSSTYLENVTINKTLTVIGEDRSSTIIDARGNESVVLVDSTSYVNVSGFTVRNGTYGLHLNDSHRSILENNNAVNNSYGIYVGKVSYPSNNNTISNNTILNNTENGVYLMASDNNTIANNNISNNKAGMNVTQSSNIIIENNTILYNDYGIKLNYSSPIVRYNNVSYNNYDGIRNYYYSNAIIGNNTIIYNNGTGIHNEHDSNATINNNTISYNTVGVLCMDSSPTITFNNITFNENGSVCYAVAWPGMNCSDYSDPTIHWNNIHNSTGYNLDNFVNPVNISAINNYWGTTNETKIAEKIIGEVTWEPYETAPIEEAGPCKW